MNAKLKKTIKIVCVLIVTLAAVYWLGPQPSEPNPVIPPINLPSDLSLLEHQINESERATPGIKPGCEAKIIWADSSQKQKAKLVFLYVHGGTSTHNEGDPVHRNIARAFNANLYLARLAGHGVDLGDQTFAKTTADDFLISAEHALAVAEKLGDEVIVMGTSFGGALTTYLASRHPEIKAIILYSPCIKAYDERIDFFTKPWGLQIVKLLTGSNTFDSPILNVKHPEYWTTHYDLNFLAQFQCTLVYLNNRKENFKKIKCPVFMAYWYKDKTTQDTTASVAGMLEMFDALGSSNKQRQAFPLAASHAIITPGLSSEVEGVQKATIKFLNESLGR